MPSTGVDSAEQGVWLEAATEDCVRVGVFYLYCSTFGFSRHLHVLSFTYYWVIGSSYTCLGVFSLISC